MSPKWIADASEWQTFSDWELFLKNIDAVILRMGINVAEDAKFRDFYRNIVNRKKRVGVYYFYRPDMPPENQLAKCLSIFKSLKHTPLFFALDCELNSYIDPNTGARVINYPPDAITFSTWLVTFLEGFEAATGIRPAIYTGAWFWDGNTCPKGTVLTINNQPYTVDWTKWKLWVASYTSTPRIPVDWAGLTEPFLIWQYGIAQTYAGVGTALDMNEMNVDDATFDKYFPVPKVKDIDVEIGWPCEPHPVITYRFGADPSIYQSVGYPGHEGTDFGVIIGTPVYACYNGVVEEVSNAGVYGNHIRIKHIRNGNVYHTLYAHLSSMLVKVGDAVQYSQKIGLSGNSGNTNGQHLHLGLMIDGLVSGYPGNEIDPMLYMDDVIDVIIPPENPPDNPPPATVYTQAQVLVSDLRLRSAPTLTADSFVAYLNPGTPILKLAQPNEEIVVNGVTFEKVSLWVAKSQGINNYLKLT